MKKKIISIFVVISSLLFLFLIFFATFKQVQKVVSRPTEYYLDSLDTKYPEVIEYLQTKGLNANYNKEYEILIIEDSDYDFYFNKTGKIRKIDDGSIMISIDSLSDEASVESLVIMLGGGFDAPKVRYDTDDLSKPHAFYIGDNLKYADDQIKKAISNEEIKELVEKAEYYEKLIKDYFDESSTVVD